MENESTLLTANSIHSNYITNSTALSLNLQFLAIHKEKNLKQTSCIMFTVVNV